MLLWFARSVSDRSHVVMISEVTLRQFLSARFLSLDCAVHTLQLHPNFWVSCGEVEVCAAPERRRECVPC